MSGHSHAKTVKRTKDANATQRGKIFSKLSRMISVAAKEGSDPNINSKLRQALEEAKKFNLPKDNVERAIRRGTGEEGGEQLEEVMYEAVGPSGVNLILEGITDNKNRTLSEVRQVLQKHNFKLALVGAVKWAFEQKGIITISPKSKVQSPKPREEMELEAIEAGAEDIRHYTEDEGEFLEIYTKVEELEKVKADLEAKGIQVESSTLGWTPKTEIELAVKDKETCEKLFEELDENEAIQEIYSNLAS